MSCGVTPREHLLFLLSVSDCPSGSCYSILSFSSLSSASLDSSSFFTPPRQARRAADPSFFLNVLLSLFRAMTASAILLDSISLSLSLSFDLALSSASRRRRCLSSHRLYCHLLLFLSFFLAFVTYLYLSIYNLSILYLSLISLSVIYLAIFDLSSYVTIDRSICLPLYLLFLCIVCFCTL